MAIGIGLKYYPYRPRGAPTLPSTPETGNVRVTTRRNLQFSSVALALYLLRSFPPLTTGGRLSPLLQALRCCQAAMGGLGLPVRAAPAEAWGACTLLLQAAAASRTALAALEPGR